ncbi:MAG: VOC family protein [Rhizobium sp.]|nr:VOC family protein [Rhizobium sp.]MBW8320293.1 VOC family protein [Rhizobium sp.]MBW8447128.1 VOC family protein [Arenimonas sp.]
MTQPLEGILETALYAADLDAAEAFFGGILGLEKVSRQGNRHLFYRCGPGMLLIFNPAETAKPVPAGALAVPSHGASGPGHVCFRVRGAEMERIIERLEAAGVPLESDVCWPNGARSIYFRDPAGNSLECAEPRLWNLE